MKYEELTKKIIGCVYNVYNSLGFGYLESVYEKALMVELNLAGLEAKSQVPIAIKYRDYAVGDFIADIVVEDKIILELKSVKHLSKIHEIQLVNYLVATGKDVGLLINFAEEKVEIKRKVRELSKKSELS